MVVSKIRNMIVERRLPWFIKNNQEKFRNRYFYCKNRRFWQNRVQLTPRQNNQKKTIQFICGFHGKAGSIFAISDVANLLTHQGFHVEFVSHPESNFNPLLEKSVKIIQQPDMNADIYICDVSCDHSFFQTLRKEGKKCIVTCHGKLDAGHGLNPDYVYQSLLFADKVHFVSSVQQESFCLQEGHYIIIPNMTRPINKTQRTNNTGVVGNLQNEKKNAKESVAISLQSKADFIHLWGADSTRFCHPKIKQHGWENNKEKIYNSFDVLVFMSKNECLSMVIIESMSSGIPCLLSAITASEQFRDCPGVKIIDDSNRKIAPQILDKLLDQKDDLREPIIKYWKENYSEKAVSQKWVEMVSSLIKTP